MGGGRGQHLSSSGVMMAEEREKEGKLSLSFFFFFFFLPQTLVQLKTLFRKSWTFHD